MSDTAIFLGAGASKAEGAPLQGELFHDYFSSNLYQPKNEKMDKELTEFFSFIFGINFKNKNISNLDFPTFEEVLGLTDLAILRKEAFKNFDIENRSTNSGRLRFIAQYLVFLVAKVLDAKLQQTAIYHRKLVKTLQEEGVLKSVVFVTTNYDIIIDNALTELYNKNIHLDYGVDFRNFERPDDWKRPLRKHQVSLFKPHGSLNWLFCPTCNELEITPKEKGVVTRLISDFKQASCPECESIYMPLIVPPTFYKDLNNVFLSSIWNRTDNALRKVNHVVFCGYSFPDADIHIKYLLKRAQTNRKTKLNFTIINDYKGKKQANRDDEQYRFKRFLGPDVKYLPMSFEQFAEDPLTVLK